MKPSTSTDGEPHNIPSPPKSPWNANALPWTLTNPHCGVMQFNAEQMVPNPFNTKALNSHKRKYEIIPPIPNKQLITEERMAAHFNGLHISDSIKEDPDTDDSIEIDLSGFSGDTRTFNVPMTAKELEEKLKNANRVIVCDELKKFEGAESFLPKLLRDRIESPCTALVLWQPQPKLNDLIGPSNAVRPNDDIDSDDEEDNNNSSSVDYNNSNNNSMDVMDTDL